MTAADATKVLGGGAALSEALLAAVVIDGNARGSLAGGFLGKSLQARWLGGKMEVLTAERLASFEFEVEGDAPAGTGADVPATAWGG